MHPELMRQYLEYYRDLGIASLYRRSAPVTPLATPEPQAAESASESLDDIRADIGDCRRCRLHEQRNKIVFGDGNPQTKLVFVGEGPGADEDAQGIPFVAAPGNC